jgi:hypothetical protein
VYIPFYIGGDCFEHVFLIFGQLIEFLWIGANCLQEDGFVAFQNQLPNVWDRRIQWRMKVYK